jgi:hypothetical protein
MRIPKLIFRASRDGYNIHTLYDKALEHKDSYHHVAIFVQTIPYEDGDALTFGGYMDEVPYINNDKYQGGPDSFVFTVKPKA